MYRGAGAWSMRRGDFSDRSTLTEKYGISQHAGIAVSRRTQHIFLFNHVSRVPTFHSWASNELYMYEGAHGGRLAERLNATVMTAWEQGRTIQVMENRGLQRTYRYIDAFILADVIAGEHGRPLFLLRPVEAAIHGPDQRRSTGSGPHARLIPIERHELVSLAADTDAKIGDLRREARLEKNFAKYVVRQGYPVWRYEICHTSGQSPMYTDLWIGGVNILLEVKSNADRVSVRMALGQLIDYTRFLRTAARAILLPEEPEADLFKLAKSQNTALIWPVAGDRWVTSEPSLAMLGIEQLRR